LVFSIEGAVLKFFKTFGRKRKKRLASPDWAYRDANDVGDGEQLTAIINMGMR